jgi:hypothetical protein
MNQKRYTRRAKILTLRILEQNDFIFLKTEKVTGIRRQTIKTWVDLYGHEVFSGKSPSEQALEMIDRELTQNNIHLIHSLSTGLLSLTDRITKITVDEKNIVKLAKALKLLNEIYIDLEKSGRFQIKHPDYTSMSFGLQFPQNNISTLGEGN